MLKHIIDYYGGSLPEDVIVTFANTGKEYEQTLRFVMDCETFWGCKIHWLEYIKRGPAVKTVIPKSIFGKTRKLIGSHSFIEVDYATASRDGRPFNDTIAARAEYRAKSKKLPPVLPNVTDRWCSGEMKHKTMDRFMRSIGYRSYQVCVGLRSDEPERVANLLNSRTRYIDYTCPLYRAGVTVEHVSQFWAEQPFDLHLTNDPIMGTYQGNCDGCFLKRTAKLLRICKEEPGRLKWWEDQEATTGAKFSRSRPDYATIQRMAADGCQGQTEEPDLNVCLCTD